MPVFRSAVCFRALFRLPVFFAWLICAASASAADGPSTVAPLMRLLESGRLPAERRGTVIEMICARGAADDLAFVLKHAVEGNYDAKLQLKVLELLTDAAVVRKVRPSGDLAIIEKLLQPQAGDDRGELRKAAARLAGIWKVPAAGDELTAIAADETAEPGLRAAAIDGLASIGDQPAKATLLQTASDARSRAIRFQAAAALAKLDMSAAAEVGAKALAAAAADDDVGPLVDAFLIRKGGPEKLAAALTTAAPSPDAAKLMLRYMYSVGRSDASLSDVLSKAAGISLDQTPPTAEELQQLLADVAAQGNAERGEKIFRRADLSCMKCHALARAGGQIGPDLSAIGSISPVDYVANSILQPNLAVKEQFVTRVFTTIDGQTITGIVVDRDDVRVRLKDAAGKEVTIATADIEEEAEGRSLMPQGLTKFLTRQELIDLVKFISELGRPGPYAIRTIPTIQRWRVMRNLPPELSVESPNVEIFREFVLDAPAEAWQSAYGTATGLLPTAELAKPGNVVFLQGEIEVVVPGEIEIRVTATEPYQLWFDAEPFEGATNIAVEPQKGRRRLTLRLVRGDDPNATLKVEIAKPAGSSAQFDVVGGS